MRAPRSLLLLPVLSLALVGLPAPAAGAAPKLERCDLGLERALRCGHLTVPMSRADPALGTTRVAFAVRTRGERSRPPPGHEPPVPAGWRAPTSFPTLILAGQVDDITSPAEARQVQRRFPRSRLYVVPNRGHSSPLYFPFRSPGVGAIRHFISSN